MVICTKELVVQYAQLFFKSNKLCNESKIEEFKFTSVFIPFFLILLLFDTLF